MEISPTLKNYAAMLGFPESQTLFHIFGLLFDTPEARQVVDALPGTVSEVAQKTALPEERVRTILHALMMKGAIGVKMDRPDYYRLFPAMIELRDSSVLNPEAPRKLFELWEKLLTTEMEQLIPLARQMKIDPMTRVVPIERSVQAQNRVLDIDAARRIFKDADLITVLPCACRTQARMVGRGQDCPAPDDAVCMQTNKFAQGVLSRDLGRKITTEDALRRIGLAEDAGLVHMVRNNVKEDMFMCNCCSCCCTGLYILERYNFPEAIAPSRFRVKLEEEACTACGQCEERCQFHAITMTDDGPQIDYDRCYGCGNCVITCPEEALTLEEVRPQEHIRVK